MMRRCVRSFAFGSLVLLALLHTGDAWSASKRFSGWTTVRNERHGFLIGYPAEVFRPRHQPITDEGRVFYSYDGRARLMVGAFTNEDGVSLRAYRRFLLEENYAGADIDYAPIRKRWFVISGTLGDEIFYQRVNFTCGGHLINSWAMIYPKTENRFYDRVLEAIAPTYSPGSGRSGKCE